MQHLNRVSSFDIRLPGGKIHVPKIKKKFFFVFISRNSKTLKNIFFFGALPKRAWARASEIDEICLCWNLG